MTSGAIHLCREPRAAHWQLGPLPSEHGHVVLLGWRTADDGGGMPDAVQHVFARAFTAVARVTFATSAVPAEAPREWTADAGGDWLRILTPLGTAQKIVARLRGAPGVLGLYSTTRASSAQRLFDDGGFPWWLQAQAAVLSPRGAPPPDIDVASWPALLDERWLDAASALREARIDAVVRPGVDGAVAGLLTWHDATEHRLLTALSQETARAGLTWHECDEGEVVPASSEAVRPDQE